MRAIGKTIFLMLLGTALCACKEVSTDDTWPDLREQQFINTQSDSVILQFYFTTNFLNRKCPVYQVLQAGDTMKTSGINPEANSFLFLGYNYLIYFQIDSVKVTTSDSETIMRLSDALQNGNLECPHMYKTDCWEYDAASKVVSYYIR
jgi:hypothetical protein